MNKYDKIALQVMIKKLNQSIDNLVDVLENHEQIPVPSNVLQHRDKMINGFQYAIQMATED